MKDHQINIINDNINDSLTRCQESPPVDSLSRLYDLDIEYAKF